MNNDIISRSALRKDIERLYSVYKDNKDYFYTDVLDHIDNAPTVEFPEQITIKCDTEEDKQKLLSALRNAKLKVLVEEDRPQGEWIDYSADEGYVECPICGHLTNCEGNIDELHYCFNCGADMRVKQ